MNINLKPILTHLKQELADLYGDRLQHLTLFGSQARVVYSFLQQFSCICTTR